MNADSLAGRGLSPGRYSSHTGSALVLALMATAVVLALASALALIAINETAVSASFVRGNQAGYLADAAIARATVELDAIADWSAVLSGNASPALTDGAADGVHDADGVLVDLPALTTALNRLAATRPFGGNNPRWRLFAWGRAERFTSAGAVGYVGVWVADDPDEQDDDPLVDGGKEAGRDVLLLSAQAFGPGGVRRMVEAVVSRTPPLGARVLVQRPVR